MFLLDRPGIKVEVDLENGVYTIDKEAEADKNRLCQMISLYARAGEHVGVFGYSRLDRGVQLNKSALLGLKLAIIDKYDVYSSKRTDAILDEVGKEAIVLVDTVMRGNDKRCAIEMEEDTIKVYAVK